MSYNTFNSSTQEVPNQEIAFVNGKFVLTSLKTKKELLSFDVNSFVEIYNVRNQFLNLQQLKLGLDDFIQKTKLKINYKQATLLWRLFASQPVLEFMTNPIAYEDKKVQLVKYDYSDIETPKVTILANKLNTGGYIYRLKVGDCTIILSEYELNSLFETLKITKDFDDFNHCFGIPYISDDTSVYYLYMLSIEQSLALYKAKDRYKFV